MELNREQIIEALEICSSDDEQCAYCCPYAFKGCARELAKDAFALYRELTEEKERIAHESQCHRQTVIDNLQRSLEYLNEETERVRADTVRKMQERLQIAFRSDDGSIREPHCYIRYIVDQIAQEILEEEG